MQGASVGAARMIFGELAQNSNQASGKLLFGLFYHYFSTDTDTLDDDNKTIHLKTNVWVLIGWIGK